jgi:prepilin-type N-terminal cleavage/methylation domain-containing protein
MWPAIRTRRAEGGFTLLEILVALAVFAIASVIAYSGLNAVVSVGNGFRADFAACISFG